MKHEVTRKEGEEREKERGEKYVIPHHTHTTEEETSYQICITLDVDRYKRQLLDLDVHVLSLVVAQRDGLELSIHDRFGSESRSYTYKSQKNMHCQSSIKIHRLSCIIRQSFSRTSSECS